MGRGLTSLLWGLLSISATTTAQPPVVTALDAAQRIAVIRPNPAYRTRPLTVECRVLLRTRNTYNIIIANETKASATHWELFTTPKDGHFHAYIPGCRPDHVHSKVSITDGKWHDVAMSHEDTRGRLFVDGQLVADTQLEPPREPGKADALVIGALVSGALGCDGLIRDVRISASVHPIPAPGATLSVEPDTIGLWRLAETANNACRDLSPTGNHALLQPAPAMARAARESGIWPSHIAGSVSAAFRPMPDPADVSRERELLVNAARELGLSSVASDSLRDAVLRAWRRDFRNWKSDPLAPGQLEYPKSRPTSWADKTAVAEQVYDRHALVWDTDNGPLDTVLRRTQALCARLSKELPTHTEFAQLRRDLNALTEIHTKTPAEPDSDRYLGAYLAACAIRRRMLFCHPRLDFSAILFVARGTFAGSVRTNPSTRDEQGGHFVTQYFGFNALPGGGLFLVHEFQTDPTVVDILEHAVVRNGRLKGRKLDHGAFVAPDLSFDGKQIVFAWTANREHKWVYSRQTAWHIFKVNTDGTGLTQLTDGMNSDFDPCWLPDGRIAFISDRRGGYIRCFNRLLNVRNYTLFAMAADGTDIIPLSYYETSEWNPSVNHEGQIVYTRWDYTDRENCLGSRFWVCNADGTDPRAPHGNYPHPYHTFPDHTPWKVQSGRESDSRMGSPLVEMGLRAIPGSTKYVFTAAPHHGEIFGSLCLLDLRVPDDGHMSQVKRITPDEPFPESEMPNRRHYRYGTPWPLSEELYLCNEWENLVLVDRFGNRELICELRLLPCAQDERLRLIEPIPLRPRQRPPTLPERTRQAQRSQTRKQTRTATVAVINVYESDLPLPEQTKVKWLRVTQNILKTNHWMGTPMVGYERESTPRIPLGVVPVEADGSVYFEAPVAKELIFQVLDEEYMAVQSMRSVAYVHPGEQLVCLGCHEHTHRSSTTYRKPLAMQRAPAKLRPEIGPIEPLSYYRQIKPIFDSTCIKCHAGSGRGPQDMSYRALKEGYTFWFSGAMWGNMCSEYSGIHGGSRTIPGRFGARNSRIGKALLSADHRKNVTPADRHKVIAWLDSNSLRLGAYRDEQAQLRGELVWPILDVDPENPVGVEGILPGLRRNFWHENQYGPYPCLLAEHEHDRVVLLDAAGTVQWEYSVPHPQDVWMLPDGSILTTFIHGVRAVTRDKKTVWEYRTESPNEVPNCQPLPDGNVLIGIVGECRLLEVDRHGNIVHAVQLATTEKRPHAQFRMCRKTAQDTYLVPFTAEGIVREFDRDGQVIRTFPRRPSPVSVLRLANGNTLISAGKAVTEYDNDGAMVWQINEAWLPDIQFGVLAGIQRLPNGNTVICNWNTRDTAGKIGAHVFEVTPDKRLTWWLSGDTVGKVAQCQLLTDDLMPRTDPIVR